MAEREIMIPPIPEWFDPEVFKKKISTLLFKFQLQRVGEPKIATLDSILPSKANYRIVTPTGEAEGCLYDEEESLAPFVEAVENALVEMIPQSESLSPEALAEELEKIFPHLPEKPKGDLIPNIIQDLYARKLLLAREAPEKPKDN